MRSFSVRVKLMRGTLLYPFLRTDTATGITDSGCRVYLTAVKCNGWLFPNNNRSIRRSFTLLKFGPQHPKELAIPRRL